MCQNSGHTVENLRIEPGRRCTSSVREARLGAGVECSVLARSDELGLERAECARE